MSGVIEKRRSQRGPVVCARCDRRDKRHPTSVPVSMVFRGESLCPNHTLDAIREAGFTLDQAMGCNHE